MAVEKGENRRIIKIPNCLRVNGGRRRFESTLIAKEYGTIQIAATAQKENDRPKSLFKDDRVNTRNAMKRQTRTARQTGSHGVSQCSRLF